MNGRFPPLDPDRADHGTWIVEHLPENRRAALRALNDLPSEYVVALDDGNGNVPITARMLICDVSVGHACPGTILAVLAEKNLLRPTVEEVS